jgi:tRNA (adenine22-N1)-methyltransferase
MLHLRPRLTRVLSYVRSDEMLWDIGCDHGYLGMRALMEKNLTGLVCIDRSPAAINKLKHKMALENLAPAVRDHVLRRLPDYERKNIRLVCADAATLPAEPVCGTVVLAGMGARSILRILNGFVFPNWLPQTQLVMLPNTERPLLEKTFIEKKIPLSEESIDDGKRQFFLYRASRDSRADSAP